MSTTQKMNKLQRYALIVGTTASIIGVVCLLLTFFVPGISIVFLWIALIGIAIGLIIFAPSVLFLILL